MLLVYGIGLVMVLLYEFGIYLCVVCNEVGSDFRDFFVIIVGKFYFVLGVVMILFLKL